MVVERGSVLPMITLPDFNMTPDEQRLLTLAVATIEPAYALVRLCPTNLVCWQAIVIGLAAERRLWEGNLRLVYSIAYDAHRRGNGDFEELFQEGCLALQRAIRRFRPELGFRLSTYAHDSIVRHVRHHADPGQYVFDSRHFKRVRHLVLEDKAPEQVSMATMARRVNPEVLDRMADPVDAYEEIHEQSMEFLELLPELHADLLRRRFGLDGPVWSQAELAADLGVSTSTISRWEQRALEQAHQLLTADRMLKVA